jgi:outer membrane immunogenic protein
MGMKYMRHLSAFVSVSALALGIGGSALAADLPVKARPAPVMAEPIASWSGLYIGAHVGGAWGTIESDFVSPPATIASGTLNGFIGGGQIGYNFQNGPIVFGIEADASWTNLSGKTPCLVVGSCEREVDWFGTVTGRIGFVADRALIYVKGGGAWAQFDYTTSFGGGPALTADDTKWGWTVGAGVEYAFLPNWSAKLEYNFMDFGKDTIDFTVPFGPGTVPVESQQFIHAVKFGLNYKFTTGPILARY